MSLDSEAVSWKAHERIDRGEDPVLPEVNAAQRVGSILAKHMASPYLTGDFWTAVGGKCIANRSPIAAIFAEVDADPNRLRESGVQLRQQQVAKFGDEDAILERLAEVNSERDVLHGWLRQMRSVYAPPEYSPDDRAGDREDDRLREARTDEAARERAPKVRAS